jgi:hypothetical protein
MDLVLLLKFKKMDPMLETIVKTNNNDRGAYSILFIDLATQ